MFKVVHSVLHDGTEYARGAPFNADIETTNRLLELGAIVLDESALTVADQAQRLTEALKLLTGQDVDPAQVKHLAALMVSSSEPVHTSGYAEALPEVATPLDDDAGGQPEGEAGEALQVETAPTGTVDQPLPPVATPLDDDAGGELDGEAVDAPQEETAATGSVDQQLPPVATPVEDDSAEPAPPAATEQSEAVKPAKRTSRK